MDLRSPGGLGFSTIMKKVEIMGNLVTVYAEVPGVCSSMHLGFY